MKTTFQILSVSSVLSVAIFICGCASSAVPSRSADVNLVVTIKAEPKAGWRDPRNDSGYAANILPGQSALFDLVDYSRLDQIIVWIEPAEPEEAPAGVLATELPKSGAITPTTTWMKYRLASGGAEHFLRDENGTIYAIHGDTFSAPGAGYFELLSDASDRPDARFFASPTTFVSSARGGDRVQFEHVPAGVAKVRAWHPRLPVSEASVTIVPGRQSAATIVVGVNSLPKLQSSR